MISENDSRVAATVQAPPTTSSGQQFVTTVDLDFWNTPYLHRRQWTGRILHGSANPQGFIIIIILCWMFLKIKV